MSWLLLLPVGALLYFAARYLRRREEMVTPETRARLWLATDNEAELEERLGQPIPRKRERPEPVVIRSRALSREVPR